MSDTTTQETMSDEVQADVEARVRRAIAEVGPEALARLAHEHQAGHVFHALWEVMRAVAWVGKTEQMRQPGSGNYDFRSIEQVIAALGHNARQHGLALQSRVVTPPTYVEHEVPKRDGKGSTTWTTARGLVMEYTWTSLRDGSTFTCQAVGEGRDSSDKATNKALTAAYKYALTQATMLPTFDPDPDGSRPEVDSDGAPEGGQGQREVPAAQGGQPEGEPGPADVLAAIRQATTMDKLREIAAWLEERGLMTEVWEDHTFEQHLDAARWVVDPQGQGEAGPAERAGERGDEPNEYQDGTS